MSTCVAGAVTPEKCAVLDMRFQRPFWFKGRLFPSAENAYQASKFSDPHIVDKFQYMPPDTAAYKGAAYKATVQDWPRQKEHVLSEILIAKFSDPELKQQLKQTGESPIVLLNFRHENDLGACACRKCRLRGRNIAGHILEQIRVHA